MDIQPAPINAIQDEIIQTFAVFADDREAMLHYLMELGDQMTPLADTYKIEKYRIPGCMSAVWLVHTLEKDRLVWEADSNTAITKGLISLLIRVLSGQTLSAIAHSELYFIEGIGMRQVIGSQRSSGLASMLKQMRLTALTYQQQLTDTQSVSAAPTAAPGESLQFWVIHLFYGLYDLVLQRLS
ncbi:MAG: SufE family protein, partial [Bacteroidota bacterium]